MSKFDTAWVNEATQEIHTPKARMVYPQLLEARGIKDKPESKPKFSVTLMLPKSANIDVIKSELMAAFKSKFGNDWAKKKGLNYPLLKTEDQERLQEYAEEFPYILRTAATLAYPPVLYNPNLTPYAADGSDIYSGRWAIAAGKFYAYDNVSKGVNFGLNKIHLLDHDEPIAGGRITTAAGFEGVEVAAPKGQKTAAQTSDAVFADGGDSIPF